MTGTTRRAFVAWGVMLLAAAPAGASDEVNELIAQVVRGPGAAQDHAIERLRYLGPSRAGPPLRALLASDDANARIGASAALAVVRDPSAVPLLLKSLGDTDWEVRKNAAHALGNLPARNAGRALGNALARDQNPRVRKACAVALAATGGGGAALVTAAAKDGELEVRLAALDSLARSMDRARAPALEALLADRSGLVRFAAARALAWSGDDAGKKFLLAALKSGDEEQERRAVTVLADCPKAWAVEGLVQASARDEVAVQAAGALASRGDRRGLRVLARLALDPAFHDAAQAKLSALGIDAREQASLAGEKP